MLFVFAVVTSSSYWGQAVAKQPLRVELFHGDQWHDVTGDVYTRAVCAITRGRGDETQQANPSSASLTFKNGDGTYNPANPLSPLYGLVGRNTPIRLSLLHGNTTGPLADASDDFSANATDSWGTADVGGAWTAFGDGGSVLNSDWQVSGGKASHYVPSANAYRATYLDQIEAVDVTQEITFTVAAATGSAMSPASFMFRGKSTSEYLMVRLFVHTTTAMQWQAIAADGTILGTAVASIAHVGGTAFRAKARASGTDVFGKVWNPSGAEPDDWDLYITDTTEYPTPGWVGVRSGRSLGNTNTTNPQFVYDDYVVTVEDSRFTGEVASWKPSYGYGDAWTEVEAGGILRRLGQGNSPLRSALYRYMTGTELVSDGVMLGYWPLEDGAGTTRAENAVAGGAPAQVSGTVEFAADDGPEGSNSLPSILSGRIMATPLSQSAPGVGEGWFVTAVFRGSGASGSVTPLELGATGDLNTWRLTITTTAATLTGYDSSGSSVSSASHSGNFLDNEWHAVTIWALRSATTTIQVGLYMDDAFDGDTAASSHTLGVLKRVLVPGVTAASNMDNAQVGHVLAYQANPSLDLMDDFISAMNGFAEESAGRRLERLCAEEGIAFTARGELDETALMGPQRVETITNLLRECSEADLGILGEPRGSLGLHYVTHAALYNQESSMALDYTAEQIAAPLAPVIDDQYTRNDVTSKRSDGGSFRVVHGDGPMSVAVVGRAATEETVNVAADDQLEDHAGWLLHLGTWDEPRYPTVIVDLDSAPDLTADVSGLDYGDVLTIYNLNHDLVEQIVQGYTEQIDSHRRTITYNCTPARPWTVAELDHATLSYLGSDGSTVDADFDAGTDTSLSVAVASGYPLWTTGSVDFDIMISGVRLAVTNISGASSPQTFTVTQAPINGVEKTIAAGEAIDIYPRSFVGK